MILFNKLEYWSTLYMYTNSSTKDMTISPYLRLPPMIVTWALKVESHKLETQLHTLTNTLVTIRGTWRHIRWWHNGGHSPTQLEGLNDWSIWWYNCLRWTHWRLCYLEDIMMCCVFPTYVKGMMLSWFKWLPPFLIDSFNTLVTKVGK